MFVFYVEGKSSASKVVESFSSQPKQTRVESEISMKASVSSNSLSSARVVKNRCKSASPLQSRARSIPKIESATKLHFSSHEALSKEPSVEQTPAPIMVVSGQKVVPQSKDSLASKSTLNTFFSANSVGNIDKLFSKSDSKVKNDDNQFLRQVPELEAEETEATEDEAAKFVKSVNAASSVMKSHPRITVNANKMTRGQSIWRQSSLPVDDEVLKLAHELTDGLVENVMVIHEVSEAERDSKYARGYNSDDIRF